MSDPTPTPAIRADLVAAFDAADAAHDLPEMARLNTVITAIDQATAEFLSTAQEATQ